MTDYSPFRHEITQHSFRCANCGVMHPIGSTLIWMPSHAHFFQDSFVDLAASYQRWNTSNSGWCSRCVDRSMTIPSVLYPNPPTPYMAEELISPDLEAILGSGPEPDSYSSLIPLILSVGVNVILLLTLIFT